MFGLFTKISEYVWGTDEGENDSASKTHLQKTTADKKKNLTSSKPRLKKDLFGKVTRLYDGSGVIEGDVYFTSDCVVGGIRPEVGTEVHVEASRDSETAGWKATRVQVMKEWKLDDAKNPASSAETFIGIITNIDQDSGVVDEDVTFKLSCVRFGYAPYQGDWVKLDLERSCDGTSEVRGVMPLREKTFTGTLTYVSSGFGYIDEDVFFTCGVCPRGYRPCRGDAVKVTAIESQQRKAIWRAIKVEPKRATPVKLRYICKPWGKLTLHVFQEIPRQAKICKLQVIVLVSKLRSELHIPQYVVRREHTNSSALQQL